MPVTHLSKLAASCGLQNLKIENILLHLAIDCQLRQNSAKSRRMRAVIWMEILGLLTSEPPTYVQLASSKISIKILSIVMGEVFREQLIDTLSAVVLCWPSLSH